MASNKSTIFTGGGLPSPYNVFFLADDGTQRATTVDGFEVNQVSPGNIWATTEAPDTVSMIGYAGLPGTSGEMVATEVKDTFAATGYQPVSGTLVFTETKDVFSAFMSVPRIGTMAVTEAADRFSAAGVGQGEDGVFITTEAPDVFAATGNVPIVGVWATTEVPDKFTAISTGVISVRKRRVFFVT